MTKIVYKEVNSCGECPYAQWGNTCFKCVLFSLLIKEEDKIHDYCKLDDKVEGSLSGTLSISKEVLDDWNSDE